ncbi:MAG: radical SAM protein [Lachnospiraceae bacterium]|nr:radical SAM protein [Lachnospiraceae bacterium]
MGKDAKKAKEFNIERYLSGGVEKIVKNALKASLTNPRESVFMGKYALASKKAAEKRRAAEERGEHVPPFLIASITSSCNLHCAGCYSRANHACKDCAPVDQLTDLEWKKIFEEANELGVGFILLAGGEPFIRRDIIKIAAETPEILFPIFTNGTMVDEEYLKLFDRNRNLVPILSIEGGQETTDARRGKGVYDKLNTSMKRMKRAGVLFGASVTVTTENMKEVLSDTFVQQLYKQGAKAIIYVEFVPVTEEAKHLAPGDKEREFIRKELLRLRLKHDDMVLISFPGDEKTSGGCLAAGRGFFHINSHGGAEPCPFSPYSDLNVKEIGLKGAMNSPLFKEIQAQELLMEDHAGGCVLFERRDQVEAILQKEK